MKKLDTEALRAAIVQKWNEMPVPPESDDPREQEHRRTILMMKRATALSAELAIFGLSEMQYTNSSGEGLQQAFLNIGQVLGNNLINTAIKMRELHPDDPNGYEYAHAAIHFIIDTFDQTMHAHFYRESGQKPDEDHGETVHLAMIEVPLKEVGDA